MYHDVKLVMSDKRGKSFTVAGFCMAVQALSLFPPFDSHLRLQNTSGDTSDNQLEIIERMLGR